MDFHSFGLRPELLRSIKELGFLHPTPIQQDAIPPAMKGQDLLACAATGSGKTAAFVLPILHKLSARPRAGTRALVVTPTRELAAQIAEHLAELATHTPITGAAIYGGVGMGPQEHALRTGVDVIVATPGRLLDHFRHSYARFDKLEFLVLDEADRMLDMGFLPDIRRILRRLPTQRQTLFFSATMPPPIAVLSREMLRQPVFINQERRAAPPSAVAQAVYPVAGHRKAALLMALLQRDEVKNVIVFTRTKQRTNRLAEALDASGVSVARIHGNRSQSQRENALEGFKRGRTRVLVATDIAARGIDVEDLSHVINFDVPHVPEDYIHRVGRTGRAGATGDAVTFCSPEEQKDMQQIERALGTRLPRVVLPDFDYEAPGGELKRRKPAGRDSAPRPSRSPRYEPRQDARRPAPGRGDARPASRDDERRPLRDERAPRRDGGSRPAGFSNTPAGSRRPAAPASRSRRSRRR
jgi:ATP-dependent RNA helicase RhlE